MRTNQDRISYRQSVLSFVNLQRFSSTFAVTLTLKQGISGAGGLAGRYQKIDMYEVRKNFRHFMNFLNRQAYGKAVERYGKRMDEIGRAHVCTPVTNAHLVCRLLLEYNKNI